MLAKRAIWLVLCLLAPTHLEAQPGSASVQSGSAPGKARTTPAKPGAPSGQKPPAGPGKKAGSPGGQKPPAAPGGEPTAAPEEPAPEEPAPVAPEQLAAAEDQRLAAIEADLVGALLARDPWRAAELGRFHLDAAAETSVALARARFDAALDAAATALGSVRRAYLAAPRAVDFDALSAWIRTERLRSTAERRAARDPAWLSDRLLAGVRACAHGSDADLEPRRRFLQALLLGVPAECASERLSLTSPSAAAVERALARAGDLRREVFETGSASLAGASEQKAASFQFALAGALRALDQRTRWLETEVMPTAGSIGRLPASTWLELVRGATGASDDLVGLEVRLLRAFAACSEASAAVPAPRLSTPEELAPAAIAERARVVARTAWYSATEAGLPLAPFAPPQTVARSGGLRPGAPAELRAAGGGALPRGGGLRFSIELPALDWRPDELAARLVQLAPSARDALAIRYGQTGEAVLLESTASTATRLFAEPSIRSGFGLFALDWVLDESVVPGALAGDDALLWSARGVQQVELARALLALELNGRDRELSEALDAFRARSRLSPQRAAEEAHSARFDPLHGAGAIAWIELATLREELEREHGPLQAVRMLIAAQRAHPNARPADLRRSLAAAAASGAKAKTTDPGAGAPEAPGAHGAPGAEDRSKRLGSAPGGGR